MAGAQDMRASLHSRFLSVACLTHSPYLHLPFLYFYSVTTRLFLPGAVYIFLDGFQFFMPPEQCAVGLTWPSLPLFVKLNLTFSSVVTQSRACLLRSMSPTFDSRGFFSPSLPGDERDVGPFLSGLT